MSLFLLAIVSTAGAEIIYVDVDASTGGNGQSWATAYKYLQDALADANSNPYVNEIWVAEGTYKPDANSADPNGSGDREATFQLLNGVGIYGGYAGVGAGEPNERDIEAYETILSGDIGTPGDSSDNSYHVVVGSGTNATAVLDGFNITAGNANGPWEQKYDRGAGIYNYEGSPTLTNCTFSGNSADYGGGMCNYSGSPTLTNCTFIGNSAELGGAVFNWDSSPKLINCLFSTNSAREWGGAVGNFSGSSPTLANCTFSGNSAYGGGAIFNVDSWPKLTNCVLWDDSPQEVYNSGYGGGAHITYSDVQGGWPGEGNINADPLFIGPNGRDGIGGTADDEDYNVHLQGFSPCINAGDPAGNYSGQVDVDGQPRVAYGRVDMGADEVFPIAGDFEPDGDVDFADFAIFAGNWLLGL